VKLFSRLKDAVSTCYVIRKRHDVAMLAARKAAEEAEEKHRQELAAVRRRTRGIAVFTGVTPLLWSSATGLAILRQCRPRSPNRINPKRGPFRQPR